MTAFLEVQTIHKSQQDDFSFLSPPFPLLLLCYVTVKIQNGFLKNPTFPAENRKLEPSISMH